MKRIVLWAMSTLTVLVLLFGYHTSTSSRMAAADSAAIAPITGGADSSGSSGSTSGLSSGSAGSTAGSGSAGGGTVPPASTPSASSPSTSASQKVLGSVEQTRWGPVQVQITVAGGRITDVSVLQYPNGNGKDQQINARALPTLIDETIAAQSADIDMVSGATITSEGYVDSLQSALDQAGL